MSGAAGGLTVERLSVELGGRRVLAGLDLRVAPGEIAVVVGGDGAGKTTLLRTIAGTLASAGGSVRRPAVTTALLGRGIYGDLTVAENLAFTAAAHGLSAWRERADRLLEAAELSAARDRRGDGLSGGMARKLATVLALLPDPGLVVLDEPTTGIDPVSRVQLWELFAGAAGRDAAVVVATSYLEEAGHADTVLVLHEGRVLAAGAPDEITAGMPGRLGMLDRRPDGWPGWRRGRRWVVHGADGRLPPDAEPVAADLEAAVIVAQLRRAGDAGPEPAAVMPAAPPDRGGLAPDQPVLTAEGVVRRFGSVVAVDGASLRVGQGEVVGLVGANGAGKTTLIRLLLGLLRPDAGRVGLLGGPPTRTARARVGYVPQTLGLWRDLTVEANLQLRRAVYGHTGEVPAVVSADADREVARLPLGRQRRIAFALALDHAPAALVLDEPTSGVDPLGRARLWETIRAAADAGAGVLVSTHYLDEAALCDRIVLLADGRVAAAGPPDELAERGEPTRRALERLLAAPQGA